MPFRLAPTGGSETLRVHAADQVAWALGVVATVAGGALPLVTFVAVAPSTLVGGDALTPDDLHLLEGSLVAGGLLLAAGIVLLVTNKTTTVSQETAGLLAPRRLRWAQLAAEREPGSQAGGPNALVLFRW
jgi:hypothetical protein